MKSPQSTAKHGHTAAQPSAIGDWVGVLEIAGTALGLELHINDTDGELTASLDCRDQGTLGIPCTAARFEAGRLALYFPSIQANFKGRLLDGNTLSGDFSQFGKATPLQLKRSGPSRAKLHRPQEPQAPFPYIVTPIRFQNKSAKITLSGTLTAMPEDRALKASILLISGSGAHNRDEEICGHRPFWVLADYLSRYGYAVLRFDDRGVGESGGDPITASSETATEDVLAAVAFIKARPALQRKPLFLIGHSEGALVAGCAAGRNPLIDAIVMLGGPGINGDQLYRDQINAIYSAAEPGATLEQHKQENLNRVIDTILQAGLREDLTGRLLPLVRETARLDIEDQEAAERLATDQTAAFNRLSFRTLIKTRPKESLSNINIPVLALAGEKDLQVLPDPNLAALKQIIDNGRQKSRVTLKKLPNLNHLFQNCDTGLPQEYGTISETFSPSALQEIQLWLEAVTRSSTPGRVFPGQSI